MTADLRSALGAQRLQGELKRHRHRWDRIKWPPHHRFLEDDPQVACSCGAVKDEAKSRAGRSARNRGNRRELELAKALGGTKVGQFGGPDDVRVGMFNVQSKVRANFPSWQWDELAKLPRTGGKVPVLIVTDSPGPGRKRRTIVVLTFDDFRDLHGEVTE